MVKNSNKKGHGRTKGQKRDKKQIHQSVLILFILLIINVLNKTNTNIVVRLIGLEPTQLALLDPKSSASTNFATGAGGINCNATTGVVLAISGCKVSEFF